jgi:multicomponent K+:H+ antiporter subunit E
MKRLVPSPFLTFLLFVMWLLLTQTFSAGQVLLGLGVAVLATRATAALKPEMSAVRSPRAIARLAAAVVADVIRSNLAVASIVLSPRRRHQSGFVRLPLELRDRNGLALLAIIITATPGTAWVDFDRKRGSLLIHVLDLVDEDHWVRLVKERYEARLLEIFGS